jgi:glycosyltransferase involved in cell wall biosynthesis
MTRPLLLDLTRSLRRAGRVATGVDRVERAYLDHFVQLDAPVFGLVRTAFGYLLLDTAGLRDFRDRLAGVTPWGRADLMSRLPRGRDKALMQAESDLRRLAMARARTGRLGDLLRNHLPLGFQYFNVGHANLSNRVLAEVEHAGGRITVLVHDVIPLDFPQFQRPGTVEPFRARMARVGRHADRVICNSADTRDRLTAFLGNTSLPEMIVAHLGVDVAAPDATRLPSGLPPEGPFFVTVGTIEPRKNHAFLLDLWQQMGSDAPPLVICGARGWNNEAVFARLDALPPGGPIHEVAGLDDAALAALIARARGLLFPTHAEGFGLPPVEALALGTRVLCNDLPVLREVLGDKAVYAPVSDGYLWLNTIKDWSQASSATHGRSDYSPPTWAAHFKTVLREG